MNLKLPKGEYWSFTCKGETHKVNQFSVMSVSWCTQNNHLMYTIRLKLPDGSMPLYEECFNLCSA